MVCWTTIIMLSLFEGSNDSITHIFNVVMQSESNYQCTFFPLTVSAMCIFFTDLQHSLIGLKQRRKQLSECIQHSSCTGKQQHLKLFGQVRGYFRFRHKSFGWSSKSCCSNKITVCEDNSLWSELGFKSIKTTGELPWARLLFSRMYNMPTTVHCNHKCYWYSVWNLQL